eukprot:GEMP01005613.1.p1 GENE.GEMP01005613.1~~GEMP01005613.1.p1  ORF type:complete len:849 (+),score=240.47 GEMP01005613.1:725-3271(+)
MHWDERMCANLMANPSKLHSSCSSALCQSEDFQWSPWLDEGTPPLQVVARDILTGMPGTSCHDRERSLRDADDEVGPPHASARTTPPSSPQSGIADGIHRAESWLTDAASSSTVVPDSAFLVYGANGNNEPATAEVYSAEPDSENGPFTAEGDAAECCSLSFSPTFFSTRCIASLPLNLNAEDLALIDTARQLEQELVAERTLHSQSCAASSAALLDNEDAEGLIVKQSAPFLAWNADCDRDDGDDDAPPSLRRECEQEEGGAGAAGGAGEGGRSSSFRIVGARGQRGTDAAVTPPARLHTLDGDDREKQQALQQALRRAMRDAERALGSRGDEEMHANDDGGQEHHNGAVDTTCDVRNGKGHRQHEDSAQYHKEHYGGGWSAEVGSRVSYGNNDVVRLAERTLSSRGYEDKHAYEDGGQEYSNGIMTTNGMRHQLCSRQHENSGQYRDEHYGAGWSAEPASRVPYGSSPVLRHAERALGSRGDDEKHAHNVGGQDPYSALDTTHDVSNEADGHQQDDSRQSDKGHYGADRGAEPASHVSRGNNVALRQANPALRSRREDEVQADVEDALDDGGQKRYNGIRTTHHAGNGADGRPPDGSGHYRKEYDGAGRGAEAASHIPYWKSVVLRYTEPALCSRWDKPKHPRVDDAHEQHNGIRTIDNASNEVANRQHDDSDQYRKEHDGEGRTQPGSRVPYRNNFVVRHAKQRLCSHSDEAEEHDDENGQQQRDGVRATHNAQTAESASESRVRGLKECNGAARNVQHSCGARVGGSLLSTPQVEESMLPFKERKVAPQCGAKVAGTPATFTTYQDGLVPERHKQPCVSGAVALQRMNNLAASALALLQATKES